MDVLKVSFPSGLQGVFPVEGTINRGLDGTFEIWGSG